MSEYIQKHRLIKVKI